MRSPAGRAIAKQPLVCITEEFIIFLVNFKPFLFYMVITKSFKLVMGTACITIRKNTGRNISLKGVCRFFQAINKLSKEKLA
jgi:hypothetical protein